MTQIVDPKRSQEYLTELERRLEKCIKEGQHDFCVDYRTISQSFPGEPHPDYFDIPLIEWHQFKHWANNHGWNVLPAPEMTVKEQQSTPRIRFIRQDVK